MPPDDDDVAEELSDIVVEGTSAGRSVVIQLTGTYEAVSVLIDPALVDPAEVATLEDALLAALRDALSQVAELQEELADGIEGEDIDLSSLLGKLGGLAGFGGLGLPDLGDLRNPEDLIAGLSGALGSLPGGLSDIMAGLGLARDTSSKESSAGAGAAGAEDERRTEGRTDAVGEHGAGEPEPEDSDDPGTCEP